MLNPESSDVLVGLVHSRPTNHAFIAARRMRSQRDRALLGGGIVRSHGGLELAGRDDRRLPVRQRHALS